MGLARIGKIKLKAGGAEVRVLHRDSPNLNGENWQGEVVKSARAVAGFDEPGSELVGFVVLGLYSDGRTSIGWRYDGNRSPIPRAMLPAYVAEVIRRDIITQTEACDVVNRANGFVPD